MSGELRSGRSHLTPAGAADLLIASAYGATSDAGQPAAPALLRRRLDALVAVVVAALGGS